METDPERFVADFVQVPRPQADGLLYVPPEARSEHVGPRAESIKQVASAHLPKGLEKAVYKARIRPRHVPILTPLFPAEPSIEDINQRNMGDCWFLAALAAIVAMGSGWAIKLMMRSAAVDRHGAVHLDHPDLAEDHALVRVHDAHLGQHYLLVEKSLVETEIPGKTYHSVGAPWVAVLEKAMTAIDAPPEGTGQTPDRTAVRWRVDPKGAHYLRLKSGRSHIAFKALLGVETEFEPIRPAVYHGADLDEEAHRYVRHIFSGGDSGSPPPPQVLMDLFQSVVPQPRAHLFYTLAWGPWVRGVLERGTNLWTTYRDAVTATQSLGSKPFRQEDFERFMTQIASSPPYRQWWQTCVHNYLAAAQRNRPRAIGRPLQLPQWPAPGQNVPVPAPAVPVPAGPPPPPLPPAPAVPAFLGGPLGAAPTLEQAVRCVVDWVRRQRIFTGERGSGRYTPAQDELYRDIQEHLRQYRPVCLGTFPSPGTRDPARQGESGEHLSKGLAGPHAYAVLDCLQVGDVKYVRVHNPWGRTGRGYTFAPDFLRLPRSTAAELRLFQRSNDPQIPPQRRIEHAYETDAGTFWLELSDVTKRCQGLYTCLQTPGVILQGRAHAGWLTG